MKMPMVEDAHGHTVKINLSAERLGTRVFIDGMEIKSLKSLTLVHSAGDISRITIEILPSRIEVDGASGELVMEVHKDGGL